MYKELYINLESGNFERRVGWLYNEKRYYY